MLVKSFISLEKNKTGYLIHADAADVMLVFMTPDIIRIRVSFAREFPEESYALVTTAWPDRLDELLRGERRRIEPLELPCTETEDALCFDTGSLRLVLQKQPFEFLLYNAAGECVYRDLPNRAFERDHLGRLSHYALMDREYDHFYGFGEKTGHLDKKGRRMRMSPKDAIGHDPESGEPLYKHIPFYLRVNERQRHALGLFYNSSYDCVFDMGNEISGYWEPYVYYQTEGPDIDLFLLNGPDAKSVIERYTLLTGRSAMLPKRALGYSASTMYYAELEKDCDAQILDVIDQYRAAGLGIDNFWLASGYSSGEEDNLRYVFNWNLRRFPQPERFVQKMREKGIDVVPNIKPGILQKHPFASEFEHASAFVRTPDGGADYVGRWWGGPGRFVDFTGRAGRAVWKDLLKRQILAKGIRTIWNDNCEYDGIEDRDALCDCEGQPDTMARLKIIQSNMMAYTAKQALGEVYPQERPFIISRAGFAGIQRYAQVWDGDNRTGWRTLKFNIATILGMGLSGVANTGCDIGGFAGGAPGEELLLRWIQNGIFQPRFCINSANDDNTVTQPWMYDGIMEEIRAAYAMRYRLLPTLYSLLREAHETGLPIWRPLFLEFPDDLRCYTDESMTFLLGSSLLVANIVEENARTRRLYLPAGCRWYDLGDRLRCYQGGQTVEVPVTRASIPMFLRGNGMLITGPARYSTQDTMHEVDILAAADADSRFVLYDDDGHTLDFERGVYTRTEISVRAGERATFTFDTTGEFANPLQRFCLRLVSPEKGACRVCIDETPLPQFLVKSAWEQAETGWYYDLSDRCICVKGPWPDRRRFTVMVSREKFDLIGMTEKKELKI